MKKILFMLIVALMPHLMYTQSTNIKVIPSQQKRIDSIFTAEYVIESSKGLSNEKALQKYVVVQDSIVRVKDSIINNYITKEKKYIEEEKKSLQKERDFLDKIESLNDKLTVANDKIGKLSDRQLDIQKSKSNTGIYLQGEFGNGLSILQNNVELKYKHVFFGLQYVRDKMIIGIKINPVNDETIYAGTISLKLW